MPELPEVESLRQSLIPLLIGRPLQGVNVRDKRLRRVVNAASLRRLIGTQVVDIDRRGKFLLIVCAKDQCLLIHLGMSGQVLLLPSQTPLDAHDHVVFDIGGEEELRYRDPRRFGSVERVHLRHLDRHPSLAILGPEPLGEDFSLASFIDGAKKRRRPIKSHIMDARVVVGIGNIYASEALHRAGIHPQRAANRIRPARLESLRQALKDTLAEAIARGGTTLSDYRDASGQPGQNRPALLVYGREGEACGRCQRTILRAVHFGRASFYCPQCQH